MPNSRLKKTVWFIVAALCALGYLAVSVKFAFHFPQIDADKANHLLQADDIIHGNFFLKGWILSGVTFLFSDLPFYELGALLFGVSLKAVYFAGAAMVAVLMIAVFGAGIFKNTKKLWVKILLGALAIGIPGPNYQLLGRVHAGGFALAVLSMMLAYSILESKDDFPVKRMILLTILLALASFSDLLVVVCAVLPILILCLSEIGTGRKNIRSELRPLVTAGVCLLAIVLSVVIDKLYFIIGAADKNAYIGTTVFTPVSEWGARFTALLHDAFALYDAEFVGRPVLSLSTILRLGRAAFQLLGCFVWLRVLFCFFTGRKTDRLSAAISLSILLTGLAYICTTLCLPRYVAFIPYLMAALVMRSFDDLFDFTVFKRPIVLLIVFACAFSAFASNVYTYIYNYTDKPESVRMTEYLEENDLHSGYASFWNASIPTVVSEGDVRVRHVLRDDDGKIMKYRWFCKDEWYDATGNFIITRADDPFGITKESVVNVFGEPEKILPFAAYEILVYDHPIPVYNPDSTEVTTFEANEMFGNENTFREQDRIRIEAGGFVFGPYAPIAASTYHGTIIGENLDEVTIDIYSNSFECFFEPVIESVSDTAIEFEFELPLDIADTEIRIFSQTDETVCFDSVTLINCYPQSQERMEAE